jgi:uncharacterized protein YdeI (YjbR/CyaY-like superfamily)
MKLQFFASPAKLRGWLQTHHADASELWIGFYRKASGKGGITYKEALDEALCFGWIDGVRHRVDEVSYRQRFTPRRPKSYWSAVNVKRAHELIEEGRMAPAGRRAFGARDVAASGRYSFERETATFTAAQLRQFRANKPAWDFFQAQPPYYRRLMAFFVTGAKKEETRARRLETLIKNSAAGRRIGLMTSSKAG